MSKQNQFKRIISLRQWTIIGVIETFFLLLALILYFTVERKVFSNVFFVFLAISATISLYAIFQFRGAKRKIYVKFHKDPNFLNTTNQFHWIIDEFYNDVFYDFDALLGAYFRRLIRNVITSLIFSATCLTIILLVLLL